MKDKRTIWIFIGTFCFVSFIFLQGYVHELSTVTRIGESIQSADLTVSIQPTDPDHDFIVKTPRKRFYNKGKSEIDLSAIKGNNSESYSITVHSDGRFGNQMFAYAAMLGIAEQYKMKPHIPADNILNYFFNISAMRISEEANLSDWEVFQEKKACTYDFDSQLLQPKGHLHLLGHFQSWKYFRKIDNQLRNEFTLIQPIRKAAVNFLRDALIQHYGVNASRKSTIFVGIHVRRDDLVNYANQVRGYTVAGWEYIESAMVYFEAKYSDSDVLFIVCTDDLEWSEQHILPMHFPVRFSKGNHPMVDFGILSLCDHMIMTVGSFGWWAAWLAGGTTTYYKDFPQKHSDLASQFDADDYFYPDWIGIPNR